MSWLAVWFAGLFLSGAQPTDATASDPVETPVEESSIKFGGGTVSSDRPVINP